LISIESCLHPLVDRSRTKPDELEVARRLIGDAAGDEQVMIAVRRVVVSTYRSDLARKRRRLARAARSIDRTGQQASGSPVSRFSRQ
jgi:hypothetical protein